MNKSIFCIFLNKKIYFLVCFFLQILCNSMTWESQEVVKSYFLKNLSTKNYISDATTQCIKIRKNSHLFKPIIGKWKKFQENHFGSCRKFTGWSLNPDLSTKANFESNWTTQKILNFESIWPEMRYTKVLVLFSKN